MATPDSEALHASMRRHPSTRTWEECPACSGVGLVSPVEKVRLIDLLVGRPLRALRPVPERAHP